MTKPLDKAIGILDMISEKGSAVFKHPDLIGVMNSDPLTKIISMSNGNPGVLRVLSEIASVNPNLLNPLKVMMDLTNTDAPLLWIVYKDINDHDITKTIEYLKDWWTNSYDNLNDYIKLYNPKVRL